MKKLIVYLFVIAFTFIASSTVLYAATVTFDRDHLSRGIIGVRYVSNVEKRTRVLIQYGDQRYQYNIRSADRFVYFPLQLGNGEYRVGVFENIEGTKFAAIASEVVNVRLDDSSRVFLNSIQIIEWTDRMNTVNLARELTRNKNTDKEKIEVLYQYMVQQFKYDFDKLGNLQYDYIPVIDDVVRRRLGICYDYSAVFASMLRSLNIRCKLVMGYTPNVREFHAWNEVFMDSRWVVVDTTFDSQMFAAGIRASFEKPRSDYTTSFEY
jgi:transglutaminase-like putative cysteine protease